MIVKDRRFEFGRLLREFREHYLGMSKLAISKMLSIQRRTIINLELGVKNTIDINTLCFLLDIGFSIEKLRDDSTKRDVEDYLELERFKKHMNHHKSKRLRFRFDVFCELNKEYIEKNYVSGILEYFNKR